MYCINCGAKLEEGDKFCANCGTPVDDLASQQGTGQQSESHQTALSQAAPEQQAMNQQSMNQYPIGQQPEMQFTMRQGGNGESSTGKPKKSKKKVIIPVLIVLFLALVAGGVTYGVHRYKVNKQTDEFIDYVKTYEAFAQQYDSLGKYKADYNTYLEEANDMADHQKVKEYNEQEDKMKKLCKEIETLNASIIEYREDYNEVTSEIEKDDRYFLEDYEDQYNELKNNFSAALDNFDGDTCEQYANEFKELSKEIIQYNENTIKAYKSDADSIIGDTSNYFEVERAKLEESLKDFKTTVEQKNYVKAKQIYDEFKALSHGYSEVPVNSNDLGDYIQMDVSENNIIKLYYGGNSLPWDKNKFKVYEFTNSKGWKEDSILDMKRVKGSMTMDLVADVSTSMDFFTGEFDSMKNAMGEFINRTANETKLGLSIISSTYRRESAFTTEKQALTNIVNGLMPEGLTSLYQSLYSSVMYTASVEGPRCVVAFTDGINEPYGSGYDYDYNDVISVANQYKIPIYIIGIGSNVDTNALEYIASSTGGQFYNNRSTADLSDIYSEIYEVQEEMWELSYKSDYPNNQPRKVYLYYDGVSDGAYLRTEFNLEPAVIVDGYSSTGLISNHDLTSFYTDAKYLSTEEIKSLGSIDEIQTVINIYFAKSGYKFGTASVLEQMKELGVIKKNGKKDGNAAENVMKNNEVIYSNFSALQNTRYEWIYSVTSDVFYEYDGDIELDEIEELVNSRLNQSKGRFNYDIEKAYKDLTSWYR